MLDFNEKNIDMMRESISNHEERVQSFQAACDERNKQLEKLFAEQIALANQLTDNNKASIMNKINDDLEQITKIISKPMML